MTEELVTEGLVRRGMHAVPSRVPNRFEVWAILAAVAPNIAAQVRRECAEQVRADLAAAGTGYDLTERLHARANSWTEA